MKYTVYICKPDAGFRIYHDSLNRGRSWCRDRDLFSNRDLFRNLCRNRSRCRDLYRSHHRFRNRSRDRGRNNSIRAEICDGNGNGCRSRCCYRDNGLTLLFLLAIIVEILP